MNSCKCFCLLVQVEYSQRQIKDLLSMINAGNMPNKNRPYEITNRGLHRSISAYGIVGKLHPILHQGSGTNFVPLESRRLASRFCKIMRIVCTLSLGVYKHGSDITRILIGYVLSDLRFDWLVGNMGVFQENLLYSRSKKLTFCFICQIIFEKYFIKAIEDFFYVYISSSKHSGSRENSRHNCLEFSQLPLVFA